MAHAADSQPETTGPVAASEAPAAPGRWAKFTDNPLLAILGTATVGLLIFTLTRTDDHISRLDDRVDAGFAAVDARFAAQDVKIDALDVKIDALDAKIDALDLKLTALIPALNATHEIEAALEGRFLDPNPDLNGTEPDRERLN